MNNEEALNAIEIILIYELSQLRENKRTWAEKDGDLEYPNLNILLATYNFLNQSSKDSIIANFESRIKNSTEGIFNNHGIETTDKEHSYEPNRYYASEIPLLFQFLCFVKSNEFAINSISNIHPFTTTFLLTQYLIYLIDNNLFKFNIIETNKLLKTLDKDFTLTSKEWCNIFKQKATNLMTKQITSIVGKYNIEINQDKLLLLDIVQKNNFDRTLSEFISQLNENSIFESSYTLSGLISNFRNFWETFIIAVAEKISDKTLIPIDTSEKTKIANSRLYIKRELKLSDNDHALISRFVDILHSEGGHAFTSTKEYFRLTKNIGIEILLLIISKFDAKINGV
ncbi:hypothetical protein [Leptospira vanthielii]|uniref:DUF262 domain-containing protein n=1 Tax=Leptospira vanthielii TaxID=293085 RepID=A0ABY2NTY6_9LEPT|nr:hypothetical protein [Leptospira vanthielii]TGM61729.1 hypothetical protein EHQ95_00325 [Leptospira vanthielii]